MDERGYINIVDRKKDMILVSGFNVYPNEIEDVAAMHAGRAGVRRDRRAGREVGRGGRSCSSCSKDPELTEGRCQGATAATTSPATSSRAIIEFRTELPKSQRRQDPAQGSARVNSRIIENNHKDVI